MFNSVNHKSYNDETLKLWSSNDPAVQIIIATSILSVGIDAPTFDDVIVYGEPPDTDKLLQDYGRLRYLKSVSPRASVPLVGYPQQYGKRRSTLASTSVVLHRDEKSAGALPKGTFSPGWPVGTASSAVGFADKEASLSPPTFTQFFSTLGTTFLRFPCSF